jgi:hypothetical protein
LSLGQGAFAMLGIGCTVLSSLGRERISAMLTALAAAVAAGVCAIIVPMRGFGDAQLHGTAVSMAVVLALALAACAVIVSRVAGAFVPLATAARACLALAIVVALGTRIPAVSRVLAPVVGIALASAYAAVLVVTGEIRAADLRWIRGALSRARSR